MSDRNEINEQRCWWCGKLIGLVQPVIWDRNGILFHLSCFFEFKTRGDDVNEE